MKKFTAIETLIEMSLDAALDPSKTELRAVLHSIFAARGDWERAALVAPALEPEAPMTFTAASNPLFEKLRAARPRA